MLTYPELSSSDNKLTTKLDSGVSVEETRTGRRGRVWLCSHGVACGVSALAAADDALREPDGVEPAYEIWPGIRKQLGLICHFSSSRQEMF